jgi:hypothetical protein
MYDCITGALIDDPVDPDDRLSLARRIVEVTDEDESLVVEFVPVDPRPLTFNR